MPAKFGRIQIPPGPAAIVMTDRDDGTLYELAARHTDMPRLALVTPAARDVQPYGAFDGPRLILPNGRRVRLLIRGGRLGYEHDNSGVSNAPVNATADSTPVVIYVLSLTMLGAAPVATSVDL